MVYPVFNKYFESLCYSGRWGPISLVYCVNMQQPYFPIYLPWLLLRLFKRYRKTGYFDDGSLNVLNGIILSCILLTILGPAKTVINNFANYSFSYGNNYQFRRYDGKAKNVAKWTLSACRANHRKFINSKNRQSKRGEIWYSRINLQSSRMPARRYPWIQTWHLRIKNLIQESNSTIFESISRNLQPSGHGKCKLFNFFIREFIYRNLKLTIILFRLLNYW